MLTLNIQKRDKKGGLNALRAGGTIPAVFYGPKEKATPISIGFSDFMKVWKQAGESSIITLVGSGEDHDALIHEVDVHPVSGIARHADFYVIEKGKKIQVKVPLVFIGESEAVKGLGGTLVKVLYEVEIEAMPKDLPRDINVDISPLVAFDSQILAKDLGMPSGVTLLASPEEVVASVYETKEEVVEEVVADIGDIKISEERGKKEEEGEAGAEAPAGKDAKEEKGK